MSAQVPVAGAELGAAVDTVQGWIDQRQRAMLAHLHSCGQSPAQLHVLGVLHELAPITVSHLATRLAISPPSASAMVDRLVDAGLAERARSDEDRRTVSVSLTKDGEEALAAAIGGRRGWLERVLGRLEPGELADTMRVLRRLAEVIEEEPKPVIG